MFLVQYNRYEFVNAEKITRLEVTDCVVKFSTCDDGGAGYYVDTHYEQKFLHHLQMLNTNMTNVETHYDILKNQ